MARTPSKEKPQRFVHLSSVQPTNRHVRYLAISGPKTGTGIEVPKWLLTKEDLVYTGFDGIAAFIANVQPPIPVVRCRLSARGGVLNVYAPLIRGELC